MSRTPYTTTIADINLELIALDDELLPPEARAALTKLKHQLTSSAEYIVLEPDLSGWGYVTHHYDPDTGRERNLGHTRVQSIIDLAKSVSQPVVISEALINPKRTDVARRLVLAGVVAVEFEFKPGEEWTS